MTDHSLGLLAETSLARLGEHRSLVFEGGWHTAVELHERSVRLAGGLVHAGVRPGDRVVVCMTNCPEMLLCYSAAWRCGAVPVPVISAVTAPELRHVLIDSGAVLSVASPASLPLVTAAAQDLPVRVVLAGPVLADGAEVLLAELETGAAADLVRRDDGDLAALLYTGARTGGRKA